MIRPAISALLASLALALPAQAASLLIFGTVALQPSATTVTEDTDFTVDLAFSAVDIDEVPVVGRYGGEVVIRFDPTLIAFQGLSLLGDATFLLPLSSSATASEQVLTFGFENAAESGTVATLEFTAIGGPGSVAFLDIEDNDDWAGSFARSDPAFERLETTTFVDASVGISAVPLPGAAWLLLTACGALAPRLRRKPAA